jgi:hypothetical protein
MTTISRDMPVAELAALVCQHLANSGIEAVLTGGAVVTIYSENEYRSDDLDFICTARQSDLIKAMASLGFTPDKGRYFVHPDTDLFIEFPAPPLAIGNEPVKTVAEKQLPTGVLKLLTPTQCVMDRLAALFHWGDRQAQRQAAMVAKHHTINWQEVERWSRGEGCVEKYRAFRKTLRKR